MMLFRWVSVIGLVFSVAFASAVSTDEEVPVSETPEEKSGVMAPFLDPDDGMLDFSEWLTTAKGFLPLGGLITEPAVGYGGYLGLMFLHDSIENRRELMMKDYPDGDIPRLPPPSITGVFGYGTENGSWGVGGMHMHVFKDDWARYLGVVSYHELNLDFYGVGGDLQLPVDHLSYTLEGGATLQQMTFRVGESDFFLGANYRYMRFDAALDLGLGITPPPWFPMLEDTLTSAGIGLIAEYDTRDSIFTPDSGINAKLENTFYTPTVGSDDEFNVFSANLRGWTPLKSNLVLGLRLDGEFSGGDIPFYMYPGINLRGISLSRYQGQHALSSEAELRWDVTQRWSLLGFGGMGWVAESSLDDFKLSDGKVAAGTGFRYLIANVYKIRTGMDFAWSEDQEFAFYFTTGTAW